MLQLWWNATLTAAEQSAMVEQDFEVIETVRVLRRQLCAHMAQNRERISWRWRFWMLLTGLLLQHELGASWGVGIKVTRRDGTVKLIKIRLSHLVLASLGILVAVVLLVVLL